MRAVLVSFIPESCLPRTYVADAPGDGALLARSRSLVCLALDAEVHDVVTANGTVINDNVPCPESYCVPLWCVSSAS